MGSTGGGHDTQTAHGGTDHYRAQGCPNGHWVPELCCICKLPAIVDSHTENVLAAATSLIVGKQIPPSPFPSGSYGEH